MSQLQFYTAFFYLLLLSTVIAYPTGTCSKHRKTPYVRQFFFSAVGRLQLELSCLFDRTSSAQATPTALVASGTSNTDIQAYLNAHNTVRAQHDAVPLTWSDNLASKAQKWANRCVFQHSGGTLGPFGGLS